MSVSTLTSVLLCEISFSVCRVASGVNVEGAAHLAVREGEGKWVVGLLRAHTHTLMNVATVWHL